MTDAQQKFYQCPECSSIVERVYQNGICRACLNKKLQTVRAVINLNHALQEPKVKIARPARAAAR